MITNLDKTTLGTEEDDELIEQSQETGLSLHDEIAQALADDNIDLKFDADGNLIGSEEDEDEEHAEEETEESSDETVEEEKPVEEKPVTKGKQLTAQELKIITLKKEKQELERQLKEKNEADTKAKYENERQAIQDKFIKEGWDEDSAKTMTETEIRLKKIEEREAITDFKEANEDVFAKYPQAKLDVSTIMRNSKLTGMTAEQICKGLYGDTMSDYDKKTLDAAKGISTRQVKDTTNVSSAIRGNSTPQTVYLTPAQQREKRLFEIKFNHGEKLKDEEYLKL